MAWLWSCSFLSKRRGERKASRWMRDWLSREVHRSHIGLSITTAHMCRSRSRRLAKSSSFLAGEEGVCVWALPIFYRCDNFRFRQLVTTYMALLRFGSLTEIAAVLSDPCCWASPTSFVELKKTHLEGIVWARLGVAKPLLWPHRWCRIKWDPLLFYRSHTISSNDWRSASHSDLQLL